MHYPTIFATWDGRPESRAALETAIRFCGLAERHLEVLCIAADLTPLGFYGAELSQAALAELSDLVADTARGLKTEASAIIGDRLTSCEVISCATRYHDVPRRIGLAARFADLIVLPQQPRTGEGALCEQMIEGALFETTVPVLISPKIAPTTIGDSILIGWNNSLEALRAIHFAMPFLRHAKQVHVVSIDAPRKDREATPDEIAIKAHLARHGVEAQMQIETSGKSSVADCLHDKAVALGSDMIVMGAYGHSRLRERILGGATRDSLHEGRVPVLMAH